MEERLLDYNVFASHQYDHRPASTYVIYLRKGYEFQIVVCSDS